MHRSVSTLRALVIASTLLIAANGVANAADAPPPATPVNLNTASADELEALPGIGASKAQAILETRKTKGGFKTVDELVDVKGIGEKQVERLRPLVTTGARPAASVR